jgi:DNA-binding GntR family transcriptional regulator
MVRNSGNPSLSSEASESLRIPPEQVVCDQLGVSRMTMREANDVPEREGYLERDAVRGTFVAPQCILKGQEEMRSLSEVFDPKTRELIALAVGLLNTLQEKGDRRQTFLSSETKPFANLL